MLAEFPNMPHIATTTDRFASGRAKLDVIQARIIWKGGRTPMGIRYMANMRAPVFPVEITMILPIAPTIIHAAMCMLRSLVREEWYDTIKTTRKVANQTGTVSKRVVILGNPRDWTIVGKK
jgi:hypothetical protein